MQVDEHSPSTGSIQFSESLEGVVHFLISEMMKMAELGAGKLVSVPNDPMSNLSQSTSAVAQVETRPSSPSVVLDLFPQSSVRVSTQNLQTMCKKQGEGFNHYAYSCFLMQALTELLCSYDSCKIAFLSYSSKKRTKTPSKESKYRTAALQFFFLVRLGVFRDY